VRKNYQRKERKSNHKFEVVEGQELLVQVPLPMAEDFGGHPIESLAPYLSPLHCPESETLDGSPSPFFKGS